MARPGLLKMVYIKAINHRKLFLPDSHSAYYDSFVSALGQSLPSSLGLSRICCTCPVSGGNGRWGGEGGRGGRKVLTFANHREGLIIFMVVLSIH